MVRVHCATSSTFPHPSLPSAPPLDTPLVPHVVACTAQTTAVLVSDEWDTPAQVAALRDLFRSEAGGVSGVEGCVESLASALSVPHHPSPAFTPHTGCSFSNYVLAFLRLGSGGGLAVHVAGDR
jgi:hypothetical protein